MLTAEELEKIVGALDAIRDEYAQRPPSDIYGRTEAEDIHHFVELELVERIGDLGLKLHTGRSRNEQIATDLRLYVREKALRLPAILPDWSRALHGPGASGGRCGDACLHPPAAGRTCAGRPLAAGLCGDAAARMTRLEDVSRG